VREAHDVDKVD